MADPALRQKPFRSGYNAKGSGLMSGGGGTGGGKRRRGTVYAFGANLSSPAEIRELVPTYDPRKDYTQNQLLLLAEKILIEDTRPPAAHPQVLLVSHLMDRKSREIYVTSGTPDPEIVQGLYWRTHPNGRRVNSDEQRKKNGASYYGRGQEQ